MSGTAKVGADAAPIPIREAQLSGDAISFELEVGSRGASGARSVPMRYEFRGRIDGKVMEGAVTMRERAGASTHAWRATLVAPAGRDDQAPVR